jgi:hypothetical protein
VRHFAEVGGPQAVKELAKKEKEYVPSLKDPFSHPSSSGFIADKSSPWMTSPPSSTRF